MSIYFTQNKLYIPFYNIYKLVLKFYLHVTEFYDNIILSLNTVFIHKGSVTMNSIITHFYQTNTSETELILANHWQGMASYTQKQVNLLNNEIEYLG